MSQLTVSDIDGELDSRICELAAREGISTSEAALRLLRKGAGLPEEALPSRTIGKSLDHLIGSMTAEESAELREALQYFDVIDESIWQ
ncbi:MAG: hypothetical protein F4Z77_12830 [Dehalococcoidia bacterium]|nr:hypothetical protein [Chloroflexota bacterium]MXW27160.1 hypothetical protein [Dehalococcoidia bacterium]MYA53965.1 hypothetical protein [Dehalococcoidia bacterium]